MSDNDTNTLSNTSEDEGKNTDNVAGKEGTGTSQTQNQEQKQSETKDKTFTQKELDEISGKARREGKEAAKKELLKQYEGKLVFTEDELQQKLDSAVKDAIDAYKKEAALQSVKEQIKTDYGLTDKQVERLSGDNEESLRKDAEDLFGAFKKKDAPKLNSGGNTQRNNSDVTSQELEVSNALKDLVDRRVKR